MNLTFDTHNLLASLDIGEGVPVYALSGTVFESRLSYGHRIDFLIAHRYRFQIRELQSLLTSFAYSRAASNAEALVILKEIQKSLLQDIRNSLSTGFAEEDMARFVIDNYMFVNRNGMLSIANTNIEINDDLRDVKMGDVLNRAYNNVLSPAEIRHLVMSVGNAATSIYKATRV
jgi:hypothetical protein